MVWCFWCCHPIEGEALHLPFKYDDRREEFKTYGHFCSWACIKAYNIDKASPRWGEIQSLITMMRLKMYGKISPCPRAPKRECLQVFGGTMSIEDFRNCKDPPHIRIPPSILIEYKPEVYSMHKGIESSVSELVIRREKPLKRMQSPLERALNKS
jgi:hypothetical protein